MRCGKAVRCHERLQWHGAPRTSWQQDIVAARHRVREFATAMSMSDMLEEFDGQRSPLLVHTLSVSAKFAYVGRSTTGFRRSGMATRIAVGS